MKKLFFAFTLSLVTVASQWARATPDENDYQMLVNSLLNVLEDAEVKAANGSSTLTVENLACKDEGATFYCSMESRDPQKPGKLKKTEIREDASEDRAADIMGAIWRVTDNSESSIKKLVCTWNESRTTPVPISCTVTLN